MGVIGSVLLAPVRYSQRKCGTCGRKFECSSATRYKIVVKGTEKVYCSYSCFREEDKARRKAMADAIAREEERARSGLKKAKPKEAKLKTRGEIRKELHDKKRHLVKRIEECRRQAEHYAALAKQTDISVRRHVRDKQYRWERRGREAQQRLEEVRRMLDETAKGEEQNV